MSERHQVIIVGGGPVGMAMAVDLGLRGIDCVVVGRHIAPQQIPKGQNLTQRTLEHFYFWGVVDELRRARVMPKGYPIGGVTAYGDMMSEHWFAPSGREVVRSFYYEDNERLPQYLTEEVLRNRAGELPSVTILYGWTAEDIKQDEGGVRVTICETQGAGQPGGRYEWGGFDDPGNQPQDPSHQETPGTKRVLEADYVVGCDGARSTVRERMGIRQSGSDFDQKMLLAVFRSEELHQAFQRFPESTTYRALHPDLKGYWMFFGRVVVGETWFFHAPVPVDTTPEGFDFQSLLNRAAGFEFKAEFEHVGFWDLRVSVADRYQVGRVFIAGDAAHSHPPYGGYGLNNGLEDVTNLGWKLAARLQGWGGDALLESYSDERRPVFWETGEDFIARGIDRDRAFLERYSPSKDPEEFKAAWKELEEVGSRRTSTYEPNYPGSSVIAGPPGAVCSAHGSHSFAARPGHHLPPQPLSGGRYLPAELGLGFTLFAFGADSSSVQLMEDAARSLDIPLKVVRDTWEGGREQYEARLVLVRPDQYVAWCGNAAPGDAAALMRRVTGMP
jgi:2-polyprenyl-6-methoxyphenol hydroxylase-like FAD-dependent oxidoreductase